VTFPEWLAATVALASIPVSILFILKTLERKETKQ